jgi:hypothetical protein
MFVFRFYIKNGAYKKAVFYEHASLRSVDMRHDNVNVRTVLNDLILFKKN